MAMDLDRILEFAVSKGVSDVHLKQGRPASFRMNGTLTVQRGAANVDTDDINRFLDLLLVDDVKRKTFADDGSADVSYDLPGRGRFRVNVFKQFTGVSLAFRVIPIEIKTIRELGLPQVLEKVAEEQRGLVLVTGATGSGKSTTLAAIIDAVNSGRPGHIITIEDPIEFMFPEKKCIVNQREVGGTTSSFASALRAALRQDPDVILLGELRDRETLEIALQAAETGHLVLSTMHTIDAVETINRAVSFFPPHDQDEIRLILAATLIWVISMRLLERKDGRGRVPVAEILRVTARIKELIMAKAGHREIAEVMAKGYKVYGMQTFDQCLMALYARKAISMEQALVHCSNPSDFKLRASGISGSSGAAFDEFVSDQKK